MEYILVVPQDSIFGSRTILIPKELLIMTRNGEYEIMKNFSCKNQVFTANGIKYVIENFLEKRWHKTYGVLDKREYTCVCEKLHYYIDDYPFEIDNKDKLWYSQSIKHLFGNLNAFEVYTRILNLKEYKITSSFLYADLSDICEYRNITDLVQQIYINEKPFQDILKNLYNNIEVVATFHKDHFPIFENISRMYTTLLADKATAIYIINRQGIAIKLARKLDSVEQGFGNSGELKPRIGIIKLDALLAEHQTSFLYPFLFGAFFGAVPFLYIAFSTRN